MKYMTEQHVARLSDHKLIRAERGARHLTTHGKPRKLRDGSLWTLSEKCESIFDDAFYLQAIHHHVLETEMRRRKIWGKRLKAFKLEDEKAPEIRRRRRSGSKLRKKRDAIFDGLPRKQRRALTAWMKKTMEVAEGECTNRRARGILRRMDREGIDLAITMTAKSEAISAITDHPEPFVEPKIAMSGELCEEVEELARGALEEDVGPDFAIDFALDSLSAARSAEWLEIVAAHGNDNARLAIRTYVGI